MTAKSEENISGNNKSSNSNWGDHMIFVYPGQRNSDYFFKKVSD